MFIKSLKNNLSAQLLKSVFFFYVIIATSLTIFQMVAEYNGSKNEINKSLKSFEVTFAPTISKAVWDMQDEQIDEIIKGMVSLPSVIAVQIFDLDGKITQSFGEKLDKNNLTSSIFFHELNLNREDNDVGKAVVYSSNTLVFKKVQTSFILLIVNSFIKTLALWILVLWISKKLITDPLGRLTRQLETMDLDNLKNNEVDLKLTKTNELTIVESSFNEMIQKLKSTFLELEVLNGSLEEKVQLRTEQLQKTNKKIRDSISFASLIQQAILPQQEILDNYTNDNFAKWQPKDIVGGDIYFVVELESKEEVLIMVIDGAGHGVPGAFVTMLVKAIETQIVARIKEGTLKPSPAEILAYFNKSIKTMLKQEKGSKSNAGFDGGIIYYNKTTKICKYAGAKTDLYIIDDNKLDIISGDKKNVGFVRTKVDQKYTEHTVTLKENSKLYLSTDGVFDQEGENKTRYGLDKFEEFLVEINNEPFEKQSMLIMKSFNDFKKDINQTDDVTVVGLNFR